MYTTSTPWMTRVFYYCLPGRRNPPSPPVHRHGNGTMEEKEKGTRGVCVRTQDTCELHVFPTIEKCGSNRKWPCSSHPHAPPGPGPCRQPPLGPTCQPEPKADRPKGTREVGDVSERVALIHGSFPCPVGSPTNNS